MAQRPQDLDTACSLACLQEEVIAATQADRGYHETNPFLAPAAFALPVLAPPPQALLPAQADDRRRPEVQRQDTRGNKAAALKAFCKSCCLCFKCGERWGRDHVCPPQVQLHVMKELWAALDLNDTDDMLQPKAE
jgi:hypothetical protein